MGKGKENGKMTYALRNQEVSRLHVKGFGKLRVTYCRLYYCATQTGEKDRKLIQTCTDAGENKSINIFYYIFSHRAPDLRWQKGWKVLECMAIMVITMISLTTCRGKLMHIMTFLTSARELRNTIN